MYDLSRFVLFVQTGSVEVLVFHSNYPQRKVHELTSRSPELPHNTPIGKIVVKMIKVWQSWYLGNPVACDDTCTAPLSLLAVKCQAFHSSYNIFDFDPVRRRHWVVALIRGLFSETRCENKTARALKWACTTTQAFSSLSLAGEQGLNVIVKRVHEMCSLRQVNTRLIWSKSGTSMRLVKISTLYYFSAQRNYSRRNTRYKNLQFVAQHCFVASSGSMFPVFNLAWSTCRATKHLLRDS